MTLTTEAAHILLQRDPTQVTPQLNRLQELAQAALSEMRSLIQQLRLGPVENGGLVPALLARERGKPIDTWQGFQKMGVYPYLNDIWVNRQGNNRPFS